MLEKTTIIASTVKKHLFKMLLTGLCVCTIGAGLISSASAATQTKNVTGGKIQATAVHQSSGNKRWTYSLAGSLNSYNNVKSFGAIHYKDPYVNENSLVLYGQLYATLSSYQTVYYGKADFYFYA